MKMRIHVYDNGKDGTAFDVSVADPNSDPVWAVVVETDEAHYRAFRHTIDVYEDCQNTLAQMHQIKMRKRFEDKFRKS